MGPMNNEDRRRKDRRRRLVPVNDERRRGERRRKADEYDRRIRIIRECLLVRALGRERWGTPDRATVWLAIAQGWYEGSPARCERGGRPYRMFTPDGPAPHSGVEGAGCSRHKTQCRPHHRHPAAPRSRRDTRVFQHGRGSNATRRQPVAHVRDGHTNARLISDALLPRPERLPTNAG